LVIEDRVLEICTNPHLGESKTGDLRGILVFKFRFNRREFLIAYRLEKSSGAIELISINFYQIGSHENFYAELKRFIRQELVFNKHEGVKK
jgi:ParE-like toxin of type II bacterial toxin-antitoxin system